MCAAGRALETSDTIFRAYSALTLVLTQSPEPFIRAHAPSFSFPMTHIPSVRLV